MTQTVHIMKEQWDFLIVLDACRYDYFEHTWKRYFHDGNISKKISVGSATFEWRNNSFTDFHDDTVYISANPYINSLTEVHGFTANHHFHKVYDVWESGWNKEIGTVLPETVTHAAIDIIPTHRNKRFIIHYLQPHAPYLSLGSTTEGFPVPNPFTNDVLLGTDKKHNSSKLQKTLFNLLLPFAKAIGLFGNRPDWYLNGFLNLPPKTPMDAVRRKFGKDQLRKAYQTNLECVLEQVAILMDCLFGKIIITADHGELLGENRCYAHPVGSSNKLLREVPWLIIEKVHQPLGDMKVPEKQNDQMNYSRQTEMDEKSIQEDLAEKLKSLGYFE